LLDTGLGLPDFCRELNICAITFYISALNTLHKNLNVGSVKELVARNAQLKTIYIEEKLMVEMLNKLIRNKWLGFLIGMVQPKK